MLVKKIAAKNTKKLFKSVPNKDVKDVPIEVQVKVKDNLFKTDTTIMIKILCLTDL